MALDVGELVGHLKLNSRHFDTGLKRGEQQFGAFGDRLTKNAVAIGAAAAVALGGALLGAMSTQDIGASIGAQIGQTDPAAIAAAGKTAGRIYADNFGTSMQSVGDALAKVMRSQTLVPQGTDAEIDAVTKSVLTLTDVFKQDLNETVQAAEQLVRNGLAPNATAAFDLITAGIQGGVDKSEDLLDVLNEYPTVLRDLGLNGQQSLGLISQGLQAGARDADTVADALKEFAIRGQDASTGSAAGFKTLGINAKKATADVAAGGPRSAAALDLVLDRLRAMTDPVQRNAAAVALFGTKAEDLGDSLFSLDLTTSTDALGDFEGATKRAADAVGETATGRLEAFKRGLETAFVDTVGGKVLPAVMDLTGWLSGQLGPAIQAVTGWMADNKDTVGLVATVLGSLAAVILVVAAAVKVWAVVQAILNAALWANPIGLVVLAIVALVAGVIYAWTHFEGFRKVVMGVLHTVGAAATWLWDNAIKPAFEGIKSGIGAVVDAVVWLWENAVKPKFELIGSIIDSVGNFVKSMAALWLWLGNLIIRPVIEAIGAVVGWLWDVAIRPAFEGIKLAIGLVGDVIGWLWRIASDNFEKIMSVVRKVGDVFGSIFGAIGGFVSSAFDKAVDVAKGAINGLIGLVNKAAGFLNENLIDKLNKIPGVSFRHIPTIPALAAGGVVQATPGGRLARLGEGGEDEAVLPLSKLRALLADPALRGGGAGGTLRVVIDGTGIMRGIRREVRAGGGRTDVVLVGA